MNITPECIVLWARVVRGLAAQGWQQSADPNTNQCRYRGQGANGEPIGCAIGVLIPADVNMRPYESLSMTRLPFSILAAAGIASATGHVTSAVMVFAASLQSLHDTGLPTGGHYVRKLYPAGLRQAFADFGASHGLEMP